MADDMRDNDERPEQADEYEKPEVEDLESDGPAETAAGLSNGATTNGGTT
jgi:hypothetical protein